MAVAEEPILSRLDRLDNMLRQLEEMKGSGRSPRSSSPSTPSSGTHTSDGQPSSLDLSPRSMEKHCLPVHRVMVETELKGSLLDRLNQLEDRVLKLCLQLEEELEAARKREEEHGKKKKGLKKLVHKVVRGGSKHQSTDDL